MGVYLFKSLKLGPLQNDGSKSLYHFKGTIGRYVMGQKVKVFSSACD